MKAITLVACLVTLTVFFAAASLTPESTKALASDQFGEFVIASLKKASFHEYQTLYPTLKELHQIMNDNSELYGKNLEAAQLEFSDKYNNELIPALKNSFKELLHTGSTMGIDWNTVKYLGIESKYTANASACIGTATILFSAGKKEFRLHIERVPVLNGQWRITQFTSLEQ